MFSSFQSIETNLPDNFQFTRSNQMHFVDNGRGLVDIKVNVFIENKNCPQ